MFYCLNQAAFLPDVTAAFYHIFVCFLQLAICWHHTVQLVGACYLSISCLIYCIFFYQHISHGIPFHIVISVLEDTCYLSCWRVLCNDFCQPWLYSLILLKCCIPFFIFFFACMSLSEHSYYSQFICPLQNYLQVTGDSDELVFRGFWEAYLKATCMTTCLTLSTRRSNWELSKT